MRGRADAPSKTASVASVPADTNVPDRCLLLPSAIACALVLARSLIFLCYEQSFFDSDQAIVGLMAKHLVEGRAFPLFYYGQAYMLVVDAWVAAPIFLVMGPTVTALHTALVLMNMAAAVLLIRCLVRWGGVTPMQALGAVVFFAFAPPLTSASLIEAGANIGPFLYVPLLWMLRRRPLWFGLVLGIGFLNREFTIYAVVALLGVELLQGALQCEERRRFWLVAMVATLATWQVLQALQPYSDMMGPGTRGQLIRGFADSQVGNIMDRIAVTPAELPARAQAMFTRHLPELWGAQRRVDVISTQGHAWLFWPLLGGLTLALLRAGILLRAPGAFTRSLFGWYLIAVGILAAGGYIATRPAEDVVYRYILLTMLLPVGIAAVWLALEPKAALRYVAAAGLAVWMAGSAIDHAAQVSRYWGGREPNEPRDLADGLVARGIRTAQAGYWRAYKVTFLAREQVKIASTDMVRIDEYQRTAAATARLLTITEEPCAGAEKVSLWYLCPPAE
ncbi:MAG: hypothetical protein ABI051_08460 [Vicinamibacterales bacterium]